MSYLFHGYYDALTRDILGKHSTIQERELIYRFYAHFHPYVAGLVERLIEGSVRGLQAADTEYQKNNDGTLVALPGSTRVALIEHVQITLSNGKPRDLLGGMPVTLPDGTRAALSDGKVATLPGSILVTSPGMQVSLSDGTQAPLYESTTVTLPRGTRVTLPDGMLATLPNDTKVTFQGGKPKPTLYREFFQDDYDPAPPLQEGKSAPTTGVFVDERYPVKDLDFTSSGGYALYNWELFYHVPLIIAIQLSKNQRFEEAQQWFHYIFDPTDDSHEHTPERFWKVRPFQYTDIKLIEGILVNLSTAADPALQQDTINSIEAWKDAPFRPHLVARYRPTAYMFKTVMAYLDNLIAWGDSLFRQDTRESTNEATQLYVLAANILGPRPQEVPKKGSIRPQTYANLKKDLDAFGNALVGLETDVPFNVTPHPKKVSSTERFSTLRSLGRALYFCVPRNDNLLGYWDTVADRLFKIRNSLNIQGIFRQLPLFEPPIDPALLAKATAAGLDISAIVSGVNQPLPLVRFQFLVQKAAEICQEVKSLGNNLLSVMEKEDNEALTILRARHERVILGLAETVRYSQWQEAIKARQGLEKSLANAAQRYTYYERQLGKNEQEITIPELDVLDKDSLEKKKFLANEPEMNVRAIKVDIARDLNESGGTLVSRHEAEELAKLGKAREIQETIRALKLTAQAIQLLPDFNIDIHFWGLGADTLFGGSFFAKEASFAADVALAVADRLSYEAGRAAKIGSYARREQDWAYQSNLAAGEITQIFKQLRAAQIREAIAEREWKNHQQQIRQAEAIEYFLTGEKNEEWEYKIDMKDSKKANKAFYSWMKGEVKSLYGQAFQFAFDIARKAERAWQHELGNRERSFLRFDYLAGKEGLLAGEKLYLDIKRMEMEYHDLNQREYELTRHVSLLQVNPLALLQLRTTGRCTFSLPEELFDLDCPGHYFRRMRSIAVSIPCVVGPYTSVNCTLTLLKSSIRIKNGVGDGYTRTDAEDSRFNDYFGSLQAIVTSTGQSDSGLFETNLRDERYLPFEGSGVISEWQMELPGLVRQFDYDTISDVILHVRYTAREGGGLLRNSAAANLEARIEEAQAVGSVRLFSVRHEFQSEWARFKNVQLKDANAFAELTLNLREEHYPFWSQGRLNDVKRVDLFAKTTTGSVKIADKLDGTGNTETLVPDASLGNLRAGNLVKIPLPAPIGKFTLYLSDNSLEDLWLAVAWGSKGN